MKKPNTIDERKNELRQEMTTYLVNLNERCNDLIAARDPFSVYNSVDHLRSLVGQLSSAARRYRDIA